jgi:O-antigen/teichoic acid export membrane protein
VNYMGEARRRIPLVILMLVANVAVSAVLIPEIGIKGAAIGTDVAYAIWVPSHLLIIHRLLGLELRPQLLVFLRAIAAAALACVPLLLLGSDPSIPVLVVGGVLACAVYLVGLRVTNEISREDLSFLRGLLARRFEWARQR